MGRSWLDNEMTRRQYRLINGLTWIVQNEFQTVRCPHCQEEQYSRLTHIWHIDKKGTCRPEYHTNYDSNLANLKDLLISYDDGVGIIEREINGKWVLLKGGQVIGEQYDG
jgi:hypothetical protein